MTSRKESLIFIFSEFISTHEDNDVYTDDVAVARRELDKLEKPTMPRAVLPCVKIIEAFKEVNPAVGRLYAMKVQRDAADRLIGIFGEEKLLQMISVLKTVNEMPYAPKATTPLQFEAKVGQIMAFVKQEENKRGNTPKSVGVAF